MRKLVCPYCQDTVAFNPALVEGNGVLVDESTEKHQIRAKVTIPAVVHSFAIVVCPGCHSVFVAKKPFGLEWETIWPMQRASVPAEIPDPIRSAFSEALACLAVEAFGGCLLMCRTAMTRLQREQKVKSLQELRDKGVISSQLYGQADEVRLWANMVGHDDYPTDVVDSETCQELVGYVQSLLEAVYVQSARQARLRERRQQAKSKRSKN